jgi:glycosyltransferase involved in cell wall biosynthesis
MSRAKAFVFAAEEDFGITMAEAQACGTPVIAFGKGGAAEIVQNGITGVLFTEQNVESIIEAVAKFESNSELYQPKTISETAQRFSNQAFRDNLILKVYQKWMQFKS